MLVLDDGYFLSQALGFLAVGLNVVKFTRCGRRSILLWGLPVAASLAASQVFLGEWQGAAVSGVGLVAGFLNLELNRPEQWLQRWVILLPAIGIAAWVAPPSGDWITWLPFVVFVLARLGQASHSELRMRLIWISGTALWIVYFVATGNPALILSESLVLILTMTRIRTLLRQPETDTCC